MCALSVLIPHDDAENHATSSHTCWVRLQPSYMLEELVFGYLTHSGFSETARLAARDMMGGARQVWIQQSR